MQVTPELQEWIEADERRAFVFGLTAERFEAMDDDQLRMAYDVLCEVIDEHVEATDPHYRARWFFGRRSARRCWTWAMDQSFRCMALLERLEPRQTAKGPDGQEGHLKHYRALGLAGEQYVFHFGDWTRGIGRYKNWRANRARKVRKLLRVFAAVDDRF